MARHVRTRQDRDRHALQDIVDWLRSVSTRRSANSSSPSARRDDCSRDLVVDRLLLRIPEHPEPSERTDEAEGQGVLKGPDEPSQGGLAHRRVLAGRHVTHLEAEGHHPDRGAARAPEVREVRDVDYNAENASQGEEAVLKEAG